MDGLALTSRIAQAPEGQREVGLILRHDVEQILRQLAIALAFLGEAELAPEGRVIGIAARSSSRRRPFAAPVSPPGQTSWGYKLRF